MTVPAGHPRRVSSIPHWGTRFFEAQHHSTQVPKQSMPSEDAHASQSQDRLYRRNSLLEEDSSAADNQRIRPAWRPNPLTVYGPDAAPDSALTATAIGRP
jgi:hypothetical protein